MQTSKIFTILLAMLCFSSIAQEQLEVEGNAKIDNSLIIYDNTSGTPKKVATISGNFPSGANASNSPTLLLKTETSPIPSNGEADIILDSSDDIFFNTNTNTRMHVGASGRVGVGTIAPADLFHVKGDAVVGGGSTDFDLNSENLRIDGQSEQWYLGVQNESSASSTDFFIGKSGTEDGTFHIEQSGDVGIGTSTPVDAFQVNGDGVFGGGSTDYDASSESIRIIGRSDTWYMGVQNETSATASDFFIGNSSVEDGTFHIEQTGDIGIGTTNPRVRLHITGGGDAEPSGGGYAQFGETASRNLVIDDNEVFVRNNGVADDLSIQNDGGNLILCSQEQGGVGIGVNTGASIPNGYLLAVDGKVIAEEVQVEISENWPDYVFTDDYQLMPLTELEESIIQHGHLPGIPSAKHIEKEGIALGEMQVKMMEKIEELTLYIIAQQKEMNIMKLQLDNQKNN